jgi:uncharacterized membrane protein (DUF106 family)
MDFVNSMLIHGAEAVLWVWDLLSTFFGWVFRSLDAILNPILSPLLAFLNPICTWLGDVVYAALSPFPVWVGLILISAVTGVVMLIAFRHTSNQKAIGKVKDDIKANLLALKLYKDELRVTFLSQARLLWAIVRLQRYVLTPVLVMALPMLLALAQMGIRYRWRPLRSDEQTLIKMHFAPGAGKSVEVSIEPHPGMVVEVGPVPGGELCVWRVHGGATGRHTLKFHVDGETIEKELVVGDGFERVSALRPSARWTDQLFHPVGRRLAAESKVRSIEILYPSVDSWVHGADYWVVTFFIVSMAVAFIFAPVFKVRF